MGKIYHSNTYQREAKMTILISDYLTRNITFEILLFIKRGIS